MRKFHITMKVVLVLIAVVTMFTVPVLAQETPISNTTLETCQGFLVDTGLSAADYGPNEDLTMTLCPEAPETIITLYFALASFGPGDMLQIYDGTDTSGPLLGTYIEYDAQGLEIFATEDNPGGCLTLHFTSDASGAGNFVAEMSCGYPCERPFAIVESEESVPHLACTGEEITFDGSGSTVADGFEIVTWEWDFDDGTFNSDGAIVVHSFTEPGAYKVQLGVADNNITEDEPDGCHNNNLADHLVLVSTEPDWTGTSTDATICSGQAYSLDGVVAGVTYDSEPTADFGGGLFIPDDQTQCFNAELTFTSFSPGAVIEDADVDILDLFINFEHSYMGDLTITFICPNGQSLAVHQQGGGGTQLGVPDQGDGTGPGVGWDYYWSPTATNGTWADNGFGTLPAGTYESAQPFSLLDGCPLNGTWEVEVCDAWGADDGYIFDWTIHFDPELYPEPIVFTPVFGMACDSTSWEGANIQSESDDCNEIEIIANESGTYTYTAVNNFGCTYTTDVQITVVEGPEVSIEDPLSYCGASVDLSGVVTNIQSGYDYNYNWTPAEFVNGSGSDVSVDGLTEDTIFTLNVSVTGGELDNCEVTQMVEVYYIDPPVSTSEDFEMCFGETAPLQVGVQPLSLDNYLYEWTFTYPCTDPITGDETTCTETVGNQAAYGATLDGTYEVTFSMPSPCTWSATSTYVVVTEICELTIPNVFSPNGGGQWDGQNDAFIIDGLGGYPQSTIRIYNRWGLLVYSDNDFGNSAGWRPDVDEASEGTYFFILGIARTNSELVINDVNGLTIDDGEGYKFLNGSFTLVR